MLPPGILKVKTLSALGRRPELWATAVRSLRCHAPNGWWKRAPFLPLPDPSWINFRLETAYGGDGNEPISAEELIAWLEWRAATSI